jgi:bifunctional non-homologous end joining protein LigD
MTSRTRVVADQLALELDDLGGEPPGRPGSGDRMVPMLPGVGQTPFDDARWFFEPWWPGMPATLVVDAGRITLIADQLTDPVPAFPELQMLAEHVRAPQAVIPGTLLVLDADGRPDAAALRRRVADPDDRVGAGAFIAADLLARDLRSLTDLPFSARRAALLELVVDGDRFLASRGLHGEGVTLAAAAASMGIDGVSARRLDAPWRSGVAPEAWLRVPASGVAVGPVRPLLVLLQRLPLD